MIIGCPSTISFKQHFLLNYWVKFHQTLQEWSLDDLIVMRHVIENKQLIYVAKSKGFKQKPFHTDDMEI